MDLVTSLFAASDARRKLRAAQGAGLPLLAPATAADPAAPTDPIYAAALGSNTRTAEERRKRIAGEIDDLRRAFDTRLDAAARSLQSHTKEWIKAHFKENVDSVVGIFEQRTREIVDPLMRRVQALEDELEQRTRDVARLRGQLDSHAVDITARLATHATATVARARDETTRLVARHADDVRDALDALRRFEQTGTTTGDPVAGADPLAARTRAEVDAALVRFHAAVARLGNVGVEDVRGLVGRVREMEGRVGDVERRAAEIAGGGAVVRERVDALARRAEELARAVRLVQPAAAGGSVGGAESEPASAAASSSSSALANAATSLQPPVPLASLPPALVELIDERLAGLLSAAKASVVADASAALDRRLKQQGDSALDKVKEAIALYDRDFVQPLSSYLKGTGGASASAGGDSGGGDESNAAPATGAPGDITAASDNGSKRTNREWDGDRLAANADSANKRPKTDGQPG